MPQPKNGMGSAVAIAALAQQVAGIEDDQRNIRGDITNLQSRIESGLHDIANKIDQRSQPQWGIYFSGLSLVFAVLVAIGGLAYMPISQSVTRLETTDDRFREQFLRLDVFSQYDKTAAAIYDRHTDAINVLEARITSLRNDFMTIAPPAQALEDLKKRLDRLELLRLQSN